MLSWADSSSSAPALVYSTYLRSGFIPAALATDDSGNVYIAGDVTLDSTTRRTGVLVQKVDPNGRIIYARTINGSASDSAAAVKADDAGNIFVVGTTFSPDFPVTVSPALATAASPSDARSFILKLDLHGQVAFVNLLGGSAASSAQSVELTADGGIVISGTAQSGFPSTSGAYSVPDTTGRPYLLKLDRTGSRLEFSATGIGGSQLALDAAGNIYMAGNAHLDYPTTPGAFQPRFPITVVREPCLSPCFPPAGVNQYVTKVDPTAARLIYSTAVSNPGDGGGQVVNNGLAVDSEGSVYLTGTATSVFPGLPQYPFTVPRSSVAAFQSFLTKLDPAGARLVYSIPLGGASVRVGADGAVYVGGLYNAYNSRDGKIVPLAWMGSFVTQDAPAGIEKLPPGCRPNNSTIGSESYVSRVDAATGEVLSTQLIDAASLVTTGIALTGNRVWIAGAAALSSVPFTPGALDLSAAAEADSSLLPGAYLGLVDFAVATPSPNAPRIDCVIDGANGSIVRVMAPNQIVTLSGLNLGPVSGAVPAGDPVDSLEGVTVTFDGVAGKLLYVSSAQVNVLVPPGLADRSTTVVRISVNGANSAEREYAVAAWAPNLFTDLWSLEAPCMNCFRLIALNADGQLNSKSAPAHEGSVVTLYLNGAGKGPLSIVATAGDSRAEVLSISEENAFVTKVAVRIPKTGLRSDDPLVGVEIHLTLSGPTSTVDAGPVRVARGFGFVGPRSSIGKPLYTYIWVAP